MVNKTRRIAPLLLALAGLILFPLFDPIAPPRGDVGETDGIGGENPEPPLQ